MSRASYLDPVCVNAPYEMDRLGSSDLWDIAAQMSSARQKTPYEERAGAREQRPVHERADAPLRVAVTSVAQHRRQAGVGVQ